MLSSISRQFPSLRHVFQGLIIVVSIILLITIFKHEIRDLYHPLETYIRCKVIESESVVEKQGLKRILFYTSWFGHNPWPLGTELSFPCSQKCLISYNRCELPYSDAVIFHEADNYGAVALKRVGEFLKRSPSQRWVLHTHENPHNLNRNPGLYNGIFNWTVSYRFDSDIFFPYGYYKRINATQIIAVKQEINYAKGKDGLIAWAVSHCGTVRDEVVRKLLQYLPVTIIGRCSKLFNKVSPPECKLGSPNCSSYFKRFKFYLAFENGMCIDYITEKYWGKPLENSMIPIVLGSNYDAKVAIPGSYINILDFKSMEDFSKYIKYLDNNDTAYNEYFGWKRLYTVDKSAESRWFCKLCVQLYNNTMPSKIYTNLGAYWGVQNSCYKNMKKIHRLLN